MSTARNTASNLDALLDDTQAAADHAGGEVTVGQIMDSIGRRSFGPLLLLPALIAFTPLGGVPLLPTALATITILIAAQMLIGMDHVWLPQAVQRRGVGAGKLDKSVDWLRPAARVVDKLIRPRLDQLTQPPFVQAAAFVCILVALTVPPLEIIPFGGTVSWAAIGLFGLALIAHDGLLVIVAFAFSLGAAWTVWTTLL
jgi:hypothetical protein